MIQSRSYLVHCLFIPISCSLLTQNTLFLIYLPNYEPLITGHREYFFFKCQYNYFLLKASWHRCSIRNIQIGYSITCFLHPGSKVMMKSPRRVIMKSSYGKKEVLVADRDDSFVGAQSLFSIQNENGSSVLDTSYFKCENSDQDLLLDIPSNGSFPQAELLPSSSFGTMASTSSSSVYPYLVHP